jgi:hypothetical protein
LERQRAAIAAKPIANTSPDAGSGIGATPLESTVAIPLVAE